jgi:hypothetical protein
MTYLFVDCEAYGPCPSLGRLTEFGAVECVGRQSFYGPIQKSRPSVATPVGPEPVALLSDGEYLVKVVSVMQLFNAWLRGFASPYVFVSDNPAFDWQWINDAFWRSGIPNPFGHSARRIGDFYAGLVQDLRAASKWKKLRRTKHTHHPVDDAMGNAEAFEAMCTQYGINIVTGRKE